MAIASSSGMPIFQTEAGVFLWDAVSWSLEPEALKRGTLEVGVYSKMLVGKSRVGIHGLKS